MTVTADKVRELAARGERSTLDFKRQDYDWTTKASNAELAKDLMAIANVLGPNSPPGYILIGVDNGGTIVGVPPSSHLDDAALHQKVGGILNRTPRFAYTPVDIDGMSVGVYEITPGGRPYFPLRAAGVLQKSVGLFRDGTSTEPASPEMVLEWHREDDAVAHEKQLLELRKLKADAEVHGELKIITMSTSGDGAEIELEIENTGRSGFFIDSITWRGEWIVGLGSSTFPVGYVPPAGSIPVSRTGILQPGGRMRVFLRWTRTEALEHIRTSHLIVDGFAGSWFAYHFDVACHTDLGGSRVLSAVAQQGSKR